MIQDEPMIHHWHSTNLLVSDMTCLVGCRWISDSITEGISICNYADDTTIYACDIHLENVISRLENDSKIIIYWFRNNHMKLNEDKCHFMIFGERTNQEVST